MTYYKGRIVETLLEGYQNAAAKLACPEAAAPKPGQYLQAHNPSDPMEILATFLFPAGELSGSVAEPASRGEVILQIAGPIPGSWHPGTELQLRGPLGRGFTLPKRAKRVALVALDRNPNRLLSIVGGALKQGAQIALFNDGEGADLPLAVEQQNLVDLASGVKWADYLAAEISIANLENLETIFRSRIPTALAAEILIAAPMPCGGLAKCGVCTAQARNGPRLACEDGPVFRLNEFV